MSLDFRLTATRFLDAGSSAPTLAEHRNAFVKLLKKKSFTEERMITVGLCVMGTSTTLASNKSHVGVSSPRRESSPTAFVRESVAIGYNYPLGEQAMPMKRKAATTKKGGASG